MSDLVMALGTMRDQIQSVLQAAGLTNAKGTIFRGWPTSTELAKVIAQNNGQTQITLWPLKGRPTTSHEAFNQPTNVVFPSPTLTASISPNFKMLTILTPPSKGDLLHAFFGIPTWDANFGPALGTESPTQVATIIANAVNSLGVSGITADVSGTSAHLNGGQWAYANIGGTGSMSLVTASEARSVQVSVWAPNANVRERVGSAIIAGVGGVDQPRLVMPDGNILLCLYDNDLWIDKAESSYSVLRWDIFFDIEYPITKTVPLVQVEGFVVSRSLNNVALPTQRFGRSY